MFMHYYKIKVHGPYNISLNWTTLTTAKDDPDEKAIETLAEVLEIPHGIIEIEERQFVMRFDHIDEKTKIEDL